MEQANEIQDALGKSYELPDEVDEADLEAGGLLRRISKKWPLKIYFSELEALELEGEEEGPSYLQDVSAMPDFVDEAPVEVGEVSALLFFLFCACSVLIPWQHR